MIDGETIAKLRTEQLRIRLQLMPHSGFGSYARMFKSTVSVSAHTGSAGTSLADAPARPASTAIWYLLGAGQGSRWHVVDVDDIWHHIEGETLIVLVYNLATNTLQRHRLGPFDDNAVPFLAVPGGCWQAVEEVGEYALCTCLVTPGFDYHGFSLVRDMGDQGAHFETALSDWKHLL